MFFKNKKHNRERKQKLMEIYNSLETQASKEFKELLNGQLSKTKNLAEGKIIEGKVTKITEKFVFLKLKKL